jgi:hypothetical protein
MRSTMTDTQDWSKATGAEVLREAAEVRQQYNLELGAIRADQRLDRQQTREAMWPVYLAYRSRMIAFRQQWDDAQSARRGELRRTISGPWPTDTAADAQRYADASAGIALGKITDDHLAECLSKAIEQKNKHAVGAVMAAAFLIPNPAWTISRYARAFPENAPLIREWSARTVSDTPLNHTLRRLRSQLNAMIPNELIRNR